MTWNPFSSAPKLPKFGLNRRGLRRAAMDGYYPLRLLFSCFCFRCLSFGFRCRGRRCRRPWPLLILPARLARRLLAAPLGGCAAFAPSGGGLLGSAFRKCVVQCLCIPSLASVRLFVYASVSLSVVVCPVSVCVCTSVAVRLVSVCLSVCACTSVVVCPLFVCVSQSCASRTRTHTAHTHARAQCTAHSTHGTRTRSHTARMACSRAACMACSRIGMTCSRIGTHGMHTHGMLTYWHAWHAHAWRTHVMARMACSRTGTHGMPTHWHARMYAHTRNWHACIHTHVHMYTNCMCFCVLTTNIDFSHKLVFGLIQHQVLVSFS